VFLKLIKVHFLVSELYISQIFVTFDTGVQNKTLLKCMRFLKIGAVRGIIYLKN